MSGQPGMGEASAVATASSARPAGAVLAAVARGVEVASRWLDLGSVVVAAGLTAVMAGALILQVAFRFAIQSPLSWSEELARYCFVWVGSLGAAAGVRRELHPGLDLVVGRLPGRARAATGTVALALVALFAATVAVAGWRLAAFNMRQRSPAIGLPMGYPYAAVPAGAGLMALHAAALLAARMTRSEETGRAGQVEAPAAGSPEAVS
ncbi:MAG: TRAP transporter small permease [Limnochordaceae bacterium]|nr:TRAP transporter small permease [Limnochordaceae bacterium]